MTANRVLEECRSTMDIVRGLAEAGYPDQTWVASKIQTSGRGRRGRAWVSLPGNLFLSVLLRPRSPIGSWMGRIPLVVGLSCARAIDALSPGKHTLLKWPNDLYDSTGAKLGGILCEGVTQGAAGMGYVIAGIGINCLSSPGTAELGGRRAEKTGIPPGRLLDRVLQEIGQALKPGAYDNDAIFMKRLFPEIVERQFLKPETAIRWSCETSGGGVGTVAGLDPSGKLVVRLEGGQQERDLVSEEVTLL